MTSGNAKLLWTVYAFDRSTFFLPPPNSSSSRRVWRLLDSKMFRLCSLALSTLCILSLSPITTATALPGRAIAKSKYTRSHSLGDSYTFDPRDGWQTFNASNLQYKYRRDSPKKGVPKKTAPATLKSPFKQAFAIAQSLGTVLNGLKGIGKPQPVVATWCVDASPLPTLYEHIQGILATTFSTRAAGQTRRGPQRYCLLTHPPGFL
jgi:hypothetical protein